jgi:hypothetical protein
MSKRKSTGKKLRFEVFKRDSFTCQYCGAKAPDVLLHVDHIKPVARGGADVIMNLITSCAACNGGKGARELSDSTAVAKQHTQAASLQERREQLEMMMEWHHGLLSIDDAAVDGVVAMYKRLVPGWTFNENGRKSVLAMVQKYGLEEVIAALRCTATKNIVLENGRATPDSADRLQVEWSKELAYARFRRENPVETELRYIRGILRNRVRYCPDHSALGLLVEASDAGVDMRTLRNLAITAHGYRSWEAEMLAAIRAVSGGLE